MKKSLSFLLFILLLVAAVQAQTVKVTFHVNTAAVPDTLGALSTVQVRGSGGPLTWGGDSPVFLHHVSGDYWKGTAEFPAGAAIQFKFYTNTHDSVWSGAEWEHQGWEGNTNLASGNRELVVPSTDTELNLMFVNGWKENVELYETPYKADDGHFVLWVRVNMQGFEDFNPALHKVGVRGSNMSDWGQTGNISWGQTMLLSPENDHVNAGSRQYSGKNFYSGAIQVPNQYATAGVKFKVVVHNIDAPLDEDWGKMVRNPSREDEVKTAGNDTTLHWFWFDNMSPATVSHADEVVVTFQANLSKAIANKGFAFGDTLLVRSGYFGTAKEVRTKTMVRQGFTAVYSATDTVVTTIGGKLNYQFYKIKNGVEYREIFYNFYYEGDTAGQAERREGEVSSATTTIADVVDSESDLHRMPLFRNTAVVKQDVLVTLTCDVRPAIFQVMAGSTLDDIQGNLDVTTAAQILQMGVAVNGPFTGNWDTWGAGLMESPLHKMWDDGTHGDAAAGDSIYTIQIQLNRDSLDVIGQEFKFGIGGGDNEGGYGNNHIENVDDSQSTFTINAQFGSIDPVFYSAWNFDTRTAVPVVRTVKVTFHVNTAAVPDTLGALSTVQVRGSGGPLTWGGDSPVFLHHVSGDYWKGTAEFPAGAAIQFKFYTNTHDSVWSGAEWEHQGWEGNTNLASGNRELVVPSTDTELNLMFVNGWKENVELYETPYKADDGHFVLWVRVNMQGFEDFNPALHKVGVRGSNMSDWGQTGNISWGQTMLLSPENDHVNAGSRQYSGKNFYSGAIQVPNQYATAGVKFKVVVHNIDAPLDEDWGKMVRNPSREDEVKTAGNDTTLHWFWFDNMSPATVSHADEVVVTFQANLSKAIANKGFAFGDTLLVRSGYFGTAKEVRTKTMVRQGFTAVYSATDTVVTTIGGKLNYQFYKIKNGVEYREIFYNFYYEGDTAGQAERREGEVSSATTTIADVVDSESDLHRMPLFRNTAVVKQDVLVTLTCDVRPAIFQVMAGSTLDDIQGNLDVTTAAQILQMGVAVNGPFTGNWDTWGAGLMESPLHKMWDDGTHGDAAAGDSIYTIQIQLNRDSLDVIGQEFKFGIGGGDNEGGYGNNHIENVDDSQSTFTINAQFGSIDPVFYSAWNFDTRKNVTAVERTGNWIPTEFSIAQNYPNPFNPSTVIAYNLAKPAEVKLMVYNLLGNRVATLVNSRQTAGSYKVTWNAMDDWGRPVSAGIYFYRIEAGENVKMLKMMLIK